LTHASEDATAEALIHTGAVMRFQGGCLVVAAILSLLLAPAADAAAPAAPWHTNDPAPASADVWLGKTEAELRRAFGAPYRATPFSPRPSHEYAYFYGKQGKTYVGAPETGITMIVFCLPSAGPIGGARIGESLHDWAAKWGKPPNISGAVGVFPADRWLLEVQRDPLGKAVSMAAVVRRGTALAYDDGQLTLNEFCPHDGNTFPWRAGDAPPVVAGIRLGEAREAVIARLGAPNNQNVPGGKPFGQEYFLNYDKLSALGMPNDGISVILLRTPQAGDIDGLRVGQTVSALVDRWGAPPDQDGVTGIYAAGTWAVVVKLDQARKHIASLQLGWTPLKWPETKGKKPDGVYRVQ